MGLLDWITNSIKADFKFTTHIVKAFSDWLETWIITFERKWVGFSRQDLLSALKETSPQKTSLHLEDIIKNPSQTVNELFANLEKNGVPAFLMNPLLVMISISIYLGLYKDITSITSQKEVTQKILASLRPTLLGTSDAVEARQRGLIDESKLKDQLGRAGIPDADITVLMNLAKSTPSSGEIAEFAGRGGYDDAIASMFGHDDGLSEALAASKKDRDAVGVTDEHFKKMWRTHWQNPGLEQVFEMLRRNVIDRSTISAYFKSKDVPPFWESALIGISTNILNKLDVRKLHKAGILTDAELKPLFLKMGYGPDEADKLSRGTVFQNQHPEAAEQTPQDTVKAKQKDLSSGMILNALSEGLIDGNKAKNLLGSLGYSPEEIALLSAQEQHDTEKSYINALTSTYRQLYVKGLIDGDTTRKQLAAIPLTPGAVKKLMDLWNLERLADIDPPSRADVLRWHKKKFIDTETTETLLRQIGTADDFIPFYIKENT